MSHEEGIAELEMRLDDPFSIHHQALDKVRYLTGANIVYQDALSAIVETHPEAQLFTDRLHILTEAAADKALFDSITEVHVDGSRYARILTLEHLLR